MPNSRFCPMRRYLGNVPAKMAETYCHLFSVERWTLDSWIYHNNTVSCTFADSAASVLEMHIVCLWVCYALPLDVINAGMKTSANIKDNVLWNCWNFSAQHTFLRCRRRRLSFCISTDFFCSLFRSDVCGSSFREGNAIVNDAISCFVDASVSLHCVNSPFCCLAMRGESE